MRNRVIRAFFMGALTAGIAGGTVLAAAGSTPADVIKMRIDRLRELGSAVKNVNDELKSDSPQPIVIQISARTVAAAAKEQYGWFPKGSGPEAGVKTKAKAEIWANSAEFKKAQDNFAAQANVFVKAAASGNVDQIRATARPLSAACTGCHRQFRADS
jgi:cytochrome c556